MTRPARPAVPLLLVCLLALVLSGCSGGTPDAAPSASAGTSSGAATGSAAPSASASPTARPAPRPAVSACRLLTYRRAIAVSDATRTVSCEKRHTAVTIAVGRLPRAARDATSDADLTAAAVQQPIAEACRRAQVRYLGGDREARELSMLHAVGFLPTAAQVAAGTDWYRCDLIALAGDKRLLALQGGLRGALERDAVRSRYAMCGTAEPGTSGFERVACAERHSWQAVEVVGLPGGGSYPGEAAAKAAGQQRCKAVGQRRAGSSLRFQWGYEWPTKAQWDAGQRVGLCWVPA